MLGQHARQFGDAIGRKEDAQRGPRLGQPRKVLRRRHGRAAGRAGEDDRLGDLGGRQFDPQRGGRRLKGADARHHFVVDPQPIQGVHLLADRAVDGRLAGVQPHDVDLPRRAFSNSADDLLEVHRGRIVALGLRRKQTAELGFTSEPA